MTRPFVVRPDSPRLLVVAGTRPEVLKLAPIVRLLRSLECPLDAHFCLSGQHRDILESALRDLDVEPDIRLPPLEDASLSQSMSLLLARLSEVIEAITPDAVVVQGDTNTTLAGALTAFYRQLPVFHVEAGLRTADIRAPFPEEMNRRTVSQLAEMHFAPTLRAMQNLLAENVPSHRVVLTGNTGADTLRIYGQRSSPEAEELLDKLRPNSRKVLLTLHRRENCGVASGIIDAVREIVRARPDVDVIWILHANAIRVRVIRELGDCPNVLLAEPQSYRAFLHLMRAVDLILTDSGGVQEEAPSLGKPVLVLREATERMEAVVAGNTLLVGCEPRRVRAKVDELLDNPRAYEAMAQVHHLFGDGFAAERIVDAVASFFGVQRAKRVMSVS